MWEFVLYLDVILSRVCLQVILLRGFRLLFLTAILASESHKPLYEDLQSNYQVDYIAGGSGQNAMRITQRVLQKSNITIFMGCVGKDKYSEILESKARADGVNVK